MIVAIIQARMGSTRLPGKALKEVSGVPLLKYMVERVRKSLLMDQLVIATSNLEKDNVIVQFCETNHLECFRGSEIDVLSRYYQCAKKYNANIIVRLTSDCPLSDPDVIDKVISLYEEKGVDYAANTIPPETAKFPDGCDVEVFSYEALEKAHKEVIDLNDKEQVTHYFWKYNNNFQICQLNNNIDWSKYRFTVDYPEDFEVVDFLIKEIDKRGIFGSVGEIVEILESNQAIMEKNSLYHFQYRVEE